MQSTDAIHFTQVNASQSNNDPYKRGPVVESFASEMHWLYPEGTPTPAAAGTPTPVPTYSGAEWDHITQDDIGSPVVGVRHPCVIEKGDDVYLFYDRIVPLKYAQVRLTPIPTHPDKANLEKSLFREQSTGPYFVGQTICLARANKQDLVNYNPTDPNYDDNPWLNFFDGSFSQSTINGWSSPIIVPDCGNPQRISPRVIHNLYLDKYLLVCMADDSVLHRATYIYTAQNSTFTQWDNGMRIEFNEIISLSDNLVFYPYLVNRDSQYGVKGSDQECGKYAYIYFLIFDNISGGDSGAGRVLIEFD
jgi:hypothetical protein